MFVIPIGVMLALFSGLALSHEYWLDPIESALTIGDQLSADVRNGEGFIGTAYPFDPTRLDRLELISGKSHKRLAGRLGDYPAVQTQLNGPGLHLLLLDTRESQLQYESAEKFDAFLGDHALESFGDRHRERGLPTDGVIERYYRFCKAFVAVEGASSQVAATRPGQSGAALDPQGQRLELIAEQNPFEVDTLSIQVLLNGRPLVGRQVELHYRDAFRQVSRSTALSDQQGKVSFDVSAKGDYLINSVWLIEPLDDSVHWESLWASMVFEL